MAVLASTSPLCGAQGIVGGLLFRTINGKTIVSSYDSPSRKKESALQRRTRSRFAEATDYAKNVLKDPVKREYYKKKAKQLKVSSAYTAAITDFMRQGKVEQVDTSKFKRKGQIVVKAHKQGLDIAEVTIRVVSKDGKEVARGSAVQRGGNMWAYRYTERQPASSMRIIVEAKDYVGRVITSLHEIG